MIPKRVFLIYTKDGVVFTFSSCVQHCWGGRVGSQWTVQVSGVVLRKKMKLTLVFDLHITNFVIWTAYQLPIVPVRKLLQLIFIHLKIIIVFCFVPKKSEWKLHIDKSIYCLRFSHSVSEDSIPLSCNDMVSLWILPLGLGTARLRSEGLDKTTDSYCSLAL